ncbi:MAG: 3-deoxy-manno-octulosonate cytidylyltransferase [Verrucomicrobiales bacterium]|nr:3-deoxy-manno-octulosonate cytidylyltransferase [Verrucomicrobiales bacterium]
MAEYHTIGVLPARWGSTRFPGKPLHLIAGKPLIQHVWDQCRKCENLDQVVVATDDERIMAGVEAFGGKAIMTRDDHPSGTDRIAEVAEQIPEATHIINIQGDEPQICPQLIDELVVSMTSDPDLPMITAANPMTSDDPAVNDPNVVKVTIDANGLALYFSRSPIPYAREPIEGLTYYRHKGIYGFRRDFLLQFVAWSPSLLERTECLEQLRALENGADIKVILTKDQSPGIDTPEQASILDQNLRTS